MSVATWAAQTPELGAPAVPGSSADALFKTEGGKTYGPILPVGTIRRFWDTTGKLGSGEFIYMPGVASETVGDVVEYVLSANVAYTDATVTRWAGTANKGKPLAIATTANTSTTTFSWYQIGGSAVINTSGTVAAGDSAFFASTATLKTAAAAGAQVLGCIATSANGVPAANQTIYNIERPHSQGQIT